MNAAQGVRPQFLTLFLLISFASVGAIFYTPALPLMAKTFHVSEGRVQLTLIWYLLGFGFGQLFYGPLANRFGRKPVIYAGLSLAIISTLLCALAGVLHSFTLLLWFRIFQALGACVGMMITFTIVADYYKENTARLYALLVISFAVMPALLVWSSGFILKFFGWASSFYLFAIYGLIILIMTRSLPETAATIDLQALQFPRLFSGYVEQFKYWQFMVFPLMMGCTTAIIYLFAAKAPFIGIEVIGLSPNQYGFWMLVAYIGMIIGSLLSWYLAKHIRIINIVRLGVVFVLVFGVCMLIAFQLNWVNVISLFVFSFFVYAGEVIIFSNAASLATSMSTNKSNASAVMNFMNMLLSLLWVQAMSAFTHVGISILPLFFILLAIIIFGLTLLTKKDKLT